MMDDLKNLERLALLPGWSVGRDFGSISFWVPGYKLPVPCRSRHHYPLLRAAVQSTIGKMGWNLVSGFDYDQTWLQWCMNFTYTPRVIHDPHIIFDFDRAALTSWLENN